MAEEITKGLVKKKLDELGYPKYQDIYENQIILYKEDSYKRGKNRNQYLENCFSKASKRLNNQEGRPDYIVVDEKRKIIIVIECKEDVNKHQTHDNMEMYKNDLGSAKEVESYCINGSLHYTTYVNGQYDVLSIAASGITEENFRFTCFYLKKEGTLKDIVFLQDGEYNNTLMSIDSYKWEIEKKLGKYRKEQEVVERELKKYAANCNQFLRANQISAKDRAGFISAIVLALTNEKSTLYTLVECSMPNTELKRAFDDKLNSKVINYLMESLEDIWENQDKIPKIKKDVLEEYYERIMTKTLLNPPEGYTKQFVYGENILSACIFSIYENIVMKMKLHPKVDIMGTFYTVFLKYASGDAKDKGIVLTPKHITELFCDIAEHYLGKKLSEKTKVLDICTGTGAFLISALARMDANIDALTISEDEKKRRKEDVRSNCLIGVEREPEMFSLAYANMRFHGDGKSNLYACSSLLKHKGIVNENIKTKEKITLKEELELLEERPIVGMVNPPYALLNSEKKDKSGEKQTGQSELDFVYSLLEYLEEGGVGIVIIPMSCAFSKTDSKMRKEILEKHTLLATMTMPARLFQDSDVGINTCIMVFRAHIPHNESSQSVFLARWIDDGFVTIPHSGRFDKNGEWSTTRLEWKRQLQNLAKQNDSIFMYHEIKADDEWLAEAYVKTDYTTLSKSDFEKQLKMYSIFCYKLAQDDEIEQKDELYWFLDNYDDFEKNYKKAVKECDEIPIDTSQWKAFLIEDLFDINTGKDLVYSSLAGKDYNVVGQGVQNNGVVCTTDELTDYDLYDANTTLSMAHIGNFFATIQESDFYAGTRVKSLISRFSEFGEEFVSYENKFVLAFMATVINREEFRFSYGRVGSDKIPTLEIKLPCLSNEKGELIKKQVTYIPYKEKKSKAGKTITKEIYLPDFQYMEDYIKRLPYSKCIEPDDCNQNVQIQSANCGDGAFPAPM